MAPKEEHRKETEEQLAAHLRQYIAHHSLRNTPERYEILHSALSLEAIHPAFSVNMLYEYHCATGYMLSYNSIYNTLDLFEKANIVCRLPDTASGSGFCFVKRVRESMVLICNRCGSVSFYRKKRDLMMLQKISPAHFTVDNPMVVLYGRCSKCRVKPPSRNKK